MEPRPIEDGENLWRDVYRSEQKTALQKKRANRVAKTAFGSGRLFADRMSVNLYDDVALETATDEADTRAQQAAGKDRVEGWWVLDAGLLRVSRPRWRFEHKPLSENPHHTEIVTSHDEDVSWEEDRQMIHDLLGAGRWQDRAPGAMAVELS